MRKFLPVLGVVLVALTLVIAQKSDIIQRRVLLPTSKALIGPTPGVLGQLQGFAAAMAGAPDGHYAAVLNDGYGSQKNQVHQSIAILNLGTNQITDFPDDRLAEKAGQSYFLGLAFASDGKHLYASMGSISDPTGKKPGNTGNGIAVYRFEDGKVSPERFIPIPPQKLATGKKVASALRKTEDGTVVPYPAGLAVISDGKAGDQLLVANNYSDNVVLLDTTGKTLKQFDLSVHQSVPAAFPYTVVVSRDGRHAWCSLWNASQVAELDLKKGSVMRWITLLRPEDPMASGSHPTAMLLSKDEKELYVALSNTDRVAVIATVNGSVMKWLDSSLTGQKYPGSSPNALALSPNGDKLFVADASINAVAVFDLNAAQADSKTQTQAASGFIPTDWYPSALAVTGQDLLIATSKGQGTGPNNGPNHAEGIASRHAHLYIGTLLYGSLARLSISEIEKRLPELTERVKQNNLLNSDPGEIRFVHGANPIKHVIYIIKENRTYDQVFGDLKVGNGDPSLVMYGADVTPNQHKLALQFGVLDNFYDSGEVSGDGHNWSTAAITTDYNEKTWQIAYRSRERTYDFQGLVADQLALEDGVPDVDDPATGYLWDNVARHGISYRDYGEFVTTVWCKNELVSSPMEGTPSPFEGKCSPTAFNKGDRLPANVGTPHGASSPWPWGVPAVKETKATKAALQGHFDANFPDFNTDYPDQFRADEFLNEFEGFVQARKNGKGNLLPAFVLLYLPDDHTHGTTPGAPRPAASVADNDLAVGRVIEAISHSPYWDDTAIFILEDDAQNGADHVDAHRSTALVISKYAPGSAAQPFVDHRFYTTVNMIHTMESILGLPPMNQNDAWAPLMAPECSGEGRQEPFVADWSNRDNGLIYQTNPPKGQGAEQSSNMDFSRPDAVNVSELNAILWRDRKGNAPMPTPAIR
jgi:DNA-binding beta-propeller fold protein YncE